jgi:hypothetical protein
VWGTKDRRGGRGPQTGYRAVEGTENRREDGGPRGTEGHKGEKGCRGDRGQ